MEAKIPIIYEAGYHQATTIGKRRKAGSGEPYWASILKSIGSVYLERTGLL